MIRDSSVLYLSWLALLCGTMFLILAEMLPVNPPFLNADTLFVALVEIELFFILVLWPLFILRSARDVEPRTAARAALETVMLLILALPLMLIGQNVSAVPTSTFLETIVTLMSFAGAVAAIFHYGILRGVAVAPWYYFMVFLLSAGLPFFAYLTIKDSIVSPATLSSVSPFWGLYISGLAAGASCWSSLTLFATGTAIVAVILAWLCARRSARTGPCPQSGP